MRHISFRILIACILLPYILYISSLQVLEVLIQKKWTAELQGMLISDSKSLLEGRLSIEDEIKRNIDRYLASSRILKLGILPQISVKTKTGRWLYPSYGQGAFYLFGSDAFPSERPVSAPKEMLQLAERNLEIMDEGIDLSVAVQIPRTTWLANSIFVLYILLFVFLLYQAYRASVREAQRSAMSNQQALAAANSKLAAAQQRLWDATAAEKSYQNEIEILKSDLDLASDRVRETEDEALAEMEQLEKNLHESIALKEKLEIEVIRLGEELDRIETLHKVPTKKRLKQTNETMKRFKTLYKNIEIQSRAVEGFLNLESDLQLRAEELIHNINEDSNRLTVRRKVFSKKGATPTFESEFSYRGRIYWRPGPGTKTQILVIGTKNSQTRDLAYLESL